MTKKDAPEQGSAPTGAMSPSRQRALSPVSEGGHVLPTFPDATLDVARAWIAGQGPSKQPNATEPTNPLHDATDRMNGLYEVLELQFRRMALGVAAYVDMTDMDDVARGRWVTLGFEKVRNEWKLMVYPKNSEPGVADGEGVEIRKASREHRVRAADYIPKLFERLMAVSSEHVARVEATNEKLAQYAANFRNILKARGVPEGAPPSAHEEP